MRIQTTSVELYTFGELTEDAQQKAIENLYDINVEYDWWDGVAYEIQEQGATKIYFDIGRGSSCEIVGIDPETFAHSIIDNHGEHCDTYQTAQGYIEEREKVLGEAERDEDGELADEYEVDGLLDDCDSDFIKAIQEDYLSMLRREYDYLTSEEAIKETIETNEYEFTIDGVLA